MSFIRVSTCWKKALIGRLFDFLRWFYIWGREGWGEGEKGGRKNNNSLVARVVRPDAIHVLRLWMWFIDWKETTREKNVYLIADMNLDVTAEIKVIKWTFITFMSIFIRMEEMKMFSYTLSWTHVQRYIDMWKVTR